MKDWRSQSHVKWDCKYHVVIVPKYIQNQEKHERDQERGLFDID